MRLEDNEAVTFAHKGGSQLPFGLIAKCDGIAKA